MLEHAPRSEPPAIKVPACTRMAQVKDHNSLQRIFTARVCFVPRGGESKRVVDEVQVYLKNKVREKMRKIRG
jgi:hypothetical protein